MSRHIRPGQANAAGRWDHIDGDHTWPNLDRVEIEAMSENPRAAAYEALADIDRGAAQLHAWQLAEVSR